MADVIVQGRLVPQDFQLVDDDATAPAGAEPRNLLPLSFWQSLGQPQQVAEIAAGHGVWVAADADPNATPLALAPLIAQGVQTIAIRFAKFSDGRGFSLGRTLRARHKFNGQLRATGDLMPDQLLSLQRCGFDAFDLPSRFNPQHALAQLQPLTMAYQRACEPGLPQPMQPVGVLSLKAA